MLLGNQGLVTQVNIESSGNVVISPLSTSVGWASTGGMAVTSTGLTITGSSTSVDISTGGNWASTGGLKITSTGFPTSTSIDIASGNIVISTGNLGAITSLTSGTVVTTTGSKMVLYTSSGTEGTKITDGTNAMPTGDAAARPVHNIWVPNRPTSDLSTGCIAMGHGTVVADWTWDTTPKAQSSSYNLWITDISLEVTTDPTAELAIQPIAVQLAIYDTTDSQPRWYGTMEIPGNTYQSFSTPIFIQAGHTVNSYVMLGGATNLGITIVYNGFETAV